MAKANPKTVTVTKYVKNPKKKRKNGLKIPLAIVLPMARQAVVINRLAKTRGWEGGLQELMLWYGIDLRSGTPAFTLYYARHGLYQLVAGAVLHKVANRLGVNRAIGRAGIPWVRI